MAKELRLQKPLRDRPAVDRHEGGLSSGAGPMNGSRQKLLAGPRLAKDAHRGIGRRYAQRLGKEVFHG